ncbi:hypothetical protein HK103_003663 [Boothiomyces macroporosus]|uniref:Uncharacterized protein n=1 Tax=Boothiomyces macroporosus TaxID=261099 RepID=A0AAD5UHL6_9FUNG|nr:hypothetical protein HK103_003663 [Boothiomyces macroporosus]
MDRTLEFFTETKKFNPPILSKPKKNRIVKFKEINSRIFKFKCYLHLIRKPFLNISFTVDQIEVDLPSPRMVFEMTSNQKNAFYLQLQSRIKELQNEIKSTNCECRINNEIKESLNHQLSLAVEILKSLDSQRSLFKPQTFKTATVVKDIPVEEDDLDPETIQLLEMENKQLIQDYKQSLNQIEYYSLT